MKMKLNEKVKRKGENLVTNTQKLQGFVLPWDQKLVCTDSVIAAESFGSQK